jgi:hypothetical protein
MDDERKGMDSFPPFMAWQKLFLKCQHIWESGIILFCKQAWISFADPKKLVLPKAFAPLSHRGYFNLSSLTSKLGSCPN